MLTLLNLLQLLLYIPLLALAGQGVLFVLAGARRDANVFYRLLALLSRPFTTVVRRLVPARVGDAQIPIVTFVILAAAYAAVSFEKIELCLRIGVEHCR